MHVSTVSRILCRVSRVIAALCRRFVKFPTTEDAVMSCKRNFYDIASFPRIIGAIDCTHIKIDSPGDSGYPNRKYLFTPLLNPIYPEEHLYNESHIRTRNAIERCFGVLKRRFPVLAYGCCLKIETVQVVIVATAVLNNFTREMGEINVPPLPNNIEQHALDILIENGQIPYVPVGQGEIGELRRQFINAYFRNMV